MSAEINEPATGKPASGGKVSPSAHLTDAERVAVWLDLLEANEQLLLAGLQARLPPGGDLRAAYRAWHDQYCRERFAHWERMAERWNQAEEARGRASGTGNS